MKTRALCTRLMLPVLALGLCATSPAKAGWPNSPLVNVPVCTATGDQLFPSLVADGAGGTFVTWQDGRGGVSEGDIYAQRFSAAGAPQWPTDGMALCTAAGDQSNPTIVSDGAGGAIVVWIDWRGGGLGGLYAQRISAAGTVQWTANGVPLCVGTGQQSNPAVLADGAGGAIAAWSDQRGGIGVYDIYAQRISAAGAVQWTANGALLCDATGQQSNPRIVSDGGAPGGAFVTWEDYRNGASNADIYAQRISAAGSVQWAANGVTLCAATGYQYNPSIIADGAGGAIVTWWDYRSFFSDIYAQRISIAGAVQWTADGVPLCSAASYQRYPVIVPDGTGGAIVTWEDQRNGFDNSDIYAQRISAAGAAQWTADGVALCTAAGNQEVPAIASDGAGGGIITWVDKRSGSTNPDLYSQRISAGGAVQWTADGVALCTAIDYQYAAATVPDGAGGAVVSWSDRRSGNFDVYAQRVDRWGYRGAQPAIVNVRDVPNDQGGQVSLFWNASPLDSFPAFAIGDYWIWRQVPSALAQAALARGARLLPDGAAPADAPRGVFRTTTLGTATFYWELVDAQTAQGFPGYSYVAPTTCDSVAAGNPRAVFMVEARGTLAGQWWFSDPDSGYSVDNLAPAAPSPFTGEYLAGTTTLHWGVSPAADFATFRLHRGHDASFVPGPANLVVTKADTGYVDVAGGAYFYKLAAVDLHGNVGPYALLQPSGTVEVPGAGAPRALALSPPAPNPMRGSCGLRLALPREAQVTLAVFDQQGRHVRTLTRGTLPAGEHPVAWDGRDEGGRPVASALYFVRLESDGRAITRRLVVVR